MQSQKQLFDTNFNFIKVRVDAIASPNFVALVNEALQAIYSMPVGQQLINTIINTGSANADGFKVVITRPEMGVWKRDDGFTMFGNGNVATRFNEDNACNGVGCLSGVFWNANSIETPEGPRPNYIGLAHELIHAMHNLQGQALPDTEDEENFTVGLGKFDAAPITENQIRKEHEVPLRTKYD